MDEVKSSASEKNKKSKKQKWPAILTDPRTLLFCLAFIAIVVVFFTLKNIDWPKQIMGGQKISTTSEIIAMYSGTSTEVTAETGIAKDLVRRNLDGVYVEKGKENFFPVAVMIENHVDSRPPSSLSKANLVYEAEAEGAITRFLAIYATDEDLKKIGPVRSARPYYIDWAKEYGALYVHCGGSPDALDKIYNERIFDNNEFYNARFFWRDKNRSAPHNVYTSSKLLGDYLSLKGNNRKYDYEPWKYKDEPSSESLGTTTGIIIFARKDAYSVKWIYNRNNNTYERYAGGKRHQDDNGDAINAKNIIIQYTKMSVVDEKARLALTTNGSGKSLVCIDGFCKKGSWEKKKGKRTIFINSAGQEYEFNAGTTWIEILSSWAKVEIN